MRDSKQPAAQSSAPAENEGWLLVFKQLIGDKISKENLQQLQVLSNSDEITIRHPLPDVLRQIKTHLSDLFLRPDLVWRHLDYRLQSSEQADRKASPSPSENAEIVIRPASDVLPPTPQQAKQIMQRFFGKSGVKTGIQLNLYEFFKSIDDVDATTLYSRPLEKSEVTLWKNTLLPLILNKLKETPLAELRRKYVGDDTQSLGKNHCLQAGLFKKCLFVQKARDGQWRIVFDATLFYQILFPPRFQFSSAHSEHKDQKASPAAASLKVVKSHLTAALAQTVPQGVLITRKEEKRRPILLPTPASQAMHTAIYLILDISQSMYSYQENYRAQVLNFINQLATVFRPEDKLYITLFNGKIVQMNEAFTISDQDGKQAAQTFINKELQCTGGTRLYGTVNDVTTSSEFTDQDNNNQVVVLFTDGADNKSDDLSKQSVEYTLNSKDPNIFRTYTIGLGNDCDDALCNKLATKTGGKYIKIDQIDNFKEICEHLQSMCRLRTLRQFLDQTIAVYSNPRPLNISITDGQQVQIDGKEYTLNENAVARPEYRDPENNDTSSSAAILSSVYNAFQWMLSSGNIFRLFPSQRTLMNPLSLWSTPQTQPSDTPTQQGDEMNSKADDQKPPSNS